MIDLQNRLSCTSPCRRQLELLSSHVKALQFDSRSQNFINAIDRNHQLTRVALGPVADFRRFLLAKSVPGIAFAAGKHTAIGRDIQKHIPPAELVGDR